MLLAHVRDHKLGRIVAEQEYAFGDDAHGPDVTLIRPERLSLVKRKRRVQPFVPDLAIEIVSTINSPHGGEGEEVPALQHQ
jgi:Uma2 family endonuclease